MKRFWALFLSLALFFSLPGAPLSYSAPVPASSQTASLPILSGIEQALSRSEEIVAYTELDPGPFARKWEVMIRQSLDYNEPGAGTFEQCFILCHRGEDRPMVFVTEGYGGTYALAPGYTEEIASHYDANVIMVQHRYFGKSTPSPRNWAYLTVENSMNDLHRINRLMRQVYSGKWIATGISKGGQTTVMYKTYFPDDVDIAIPYVAPVCFGVEDGRHEPFIEQCGNPEQRAQIRAFQTEMLERREEIAPLFEKWCFKNNLTFRIPLEELYDYCVLEYSFAFWQWGSSFATIPAAGNPAPKMLAHLVSIAGPDYFAINDEPSFFVQAARELGYYGYDTTPFRGVLKINSAKGYLHRVMIPEDALHFHFSRKVARDIYRYLRRNDPKMIFIYGEFDPWNAVAVDAKLFRNKQQMLLMVDDQGSHRARIATLSPEQQVQVWSRIDRWLAE